MWGSARQGLSDGAGWNGAGIERRGGEMFSADGICVVGSVEKVPMGGLAASTISKQ